MQILPGLNPELGSLEFIIYRFMSWVNQGSHSWRVRNSSLQLSDLLKVTPCTVGQVPPKAPKPDLPLQPSLPLVPAPIPAPTDSLVGTSSFSSETIRAITTNQNVYLSPNFHMVSLIFHPYYTQEENQASLKGLHLLCHEDIECFKLQAWRHTQI